VAALYTSGLVITRECIADRSAEQRLAAASAAIRRALGTGEVVLLAATRSAADDAARRVATGERATIGLHRFALSQFASRLIRESLARARVVPASPLALDALATHAAFGAREAGELERVHASTVFPGFTRALRQTLHELRLAGLSCDQLEQAGGLSGHDLAAINARYGDALTQHNISDVADLFTRATAIIAQDRPAIARNYVVLLDVALHSAAERAFIAALASSSAHIVATIPPTDTESVDALTTLQFVQRPAKKTKGIASQLDQLRVGLFAEEVPASPGGPDESVTYFSAPGEGREAVEVARLVLTEARRGVPFDRMAVALRSPAAYVAHLQTAFRRAGIRLYLAGGSTRPDAGGRAFLALLACAAERLSARRFAEYLSLGQVPGREAVRPAVVTSEDEMLAVFTGVAVTADDPAEDDAPGLREPWRWEELLVEAAVVGGTDRWERRLAGLANEFALKRRGAALGDPTSERVAYFDREIARLADLTAFALPIIRRLHALNACSTWGEWLPQLEELALSTLRAPERVLAVLAELRPLVSIGPIAIADVYRALADRLTTLRRSPGPDRYGRVFVAPLDALRGRSFDVVFVPGLAERAFPQRAREDPLLLDRDRANLSDDLAVQRDRIRRERLLLELAVGAAITRLYISYPRMEVREARPRVSSFYALDIARATRGDIPAYDALERDARNTVKASMAWPAPPDAARAIDALEHDLATFRRLLDAPPSTVHGRAQYLLRLNAPLGRALSARYLRWEKQPWQSQDGLVVRPKARRSLLASYTLDQQAYGPSQLERFARCPYQFYLSAIQHLHVREEPPPIERIDVRLRGTLLHEMYAAILRGLINQQLLPVTAQNWFEVERLAEAAMDKILVARRDDLAPAIGAVWDTDVQRLRTDVRLWLRDLIAVTRAWTPLYVEFGFGVGTTDRDPASAVDPVGVTEHNYLVKGAMDLVEQAVGRAAFRVTDFKTGTSRLRRNDLLKGGEMLQPVLYSLALEKLVNGTVIGGRLWFATVRGRYADHAVPLDRRTRDAAARVLATIDDAIRAGFLPAAPKSDSCGRCDFKLICGPYEEERVGRKDQDALAALLGVRGLA
jgi:ATP-dependent helicase/nuclease subunit B